MLPWLQDTTPTGIGLSVGPVLPTITEDGQPAFFGTVRDFTPQDNPDFGNPSLQVLIADRDVKQIPGKCQMS